ncbi:MAG: ATP synthase subunit I [Calditrichaceae bacterium]|jgi:F1F0 ATPase subunit 2
MHNTYYMWVASLIIGVFLGLFYFGFMWWVARKMVSVKSPVILLIGGYAIRLSVALLVFYLIAKNHDWVSLIICVAGFIIIRTILIRKWGAEVKKVTVRSNPNNRETRDDEFKSG